MLVAMSARPAFTDKTAASDVESAEITAESGAKRVRDESERYEPRD